MRRLAHPSTNCTNQHSLGDVIDEQSRQGHSAKRNKPEHAPYYLRFTQTEQTPSRALPDAGQATIHFRRAQVSRSDQREDLETIIIL